MTSTPPFTLGLSFEKLRMIASHPFALSLSKGPCIVSLSNDLSLSKGRARTRTSTSSVRTVLFLRGV